MHALLIAQPNLSAMLTHQDSLPTPAPIFPHLYISNNYDWYYVRGYVDETGGFLDWAIIPEYVLMRSFEYDPDKIKTDWDQIVRK